MARGFLSGLIMGGVVSVGGAGVVSILADPPAAPEATVEAPTAAAVPEAAGSSDAQGVVDADLATSGGAAPVRAPEADDVTSAQAAGADTPRVPETGAASDLNDPAGAADSAAVAVDADTPVTPATAGDAPTAPVPAEELSISTVPAQPPAPAVPDAGSAFAEDPAPPAETAAPEAPAAEAPSPGAAETTAPQIAAVSEAETAPETPASPVQPAAPAVPADTDDTTGAESAEAAQPEAPQVVAALPQTDEATPTGPSIGRPAGSLVARTPEVPTAAVPVPEDTVDPDAPPIVRFASPFEPPADKPLMAIVLIDTGVDLTGGPVGLAALESFPYPLSFAVDAALPDAATRAAEYRAQGFEVLSLLELPQGATATDAEVNLSAALAAVPEAVAVIEGPGTGLQGTREGSDQITDALLASGHGMVLQSKGLNTAQKLAARAGVPTGLIFRDFDSAGQTPTVIRRFLDQAAFRAGQEGGVIMVGRVRPDTISALLLWGLQDRAERVALAPISAVLRALSEAQP